MPTESVPVDIAYALSDEHAAALRKDEATAGERDPHGIDAHTPGAKLDAGKPRPALVLGGFARALQAVTDVGTFGAQKYTPNGWVHVPNGAERYADAEMRHWLAEQAGERCDPQTGIPHAAHAAWNALARLELLLRDADPRGL